jgi:hypothetical protein
MNQILSSSTERLIEYAHAVAAKETLNVASSRFASYLRVFGIFFEYHATKLHWGAAQSLRGYCVRFPTVPASVAFV